MKSPGFLLVLFIKLTFVIIVPNALAQQSNTSYFMDWVPQSNQLNPAKQHPCNFYLGAPVLAPFEANIMHSGFTINDVLQNYKDTTILFLHPEGIGVSGFLRSLQDINYISADFGISLLSVGFKINSFYFTLDARDRVQANFTYPKALFEVPLTGMKEGGNYDFSALNSDMLYFREYSLGISEQFNDQWTVGIRLKGLFGIVGYRTDNSIHLETSINQYRIPAGIHANLSAPLELTYDEDGNIKEATLKEEYEEIDGMLNLLLSTDNFGAAIDFGAIYKPNNQFEISFSVIDLGSITWKANTYNISQSEELEFEGVNLINEDGSTVEIFDSLKLQVSESAFSTPLSTKIYLGGRYLLNDHFSFGVLTRTQIYRGKIRPQLTLSTNLNHKFISTTLSYSMMNNSYNNFGIGLNFKVGPFNLYMITDNAPINNNMIIADDGSSFPFPYKSKTLLNIRAGLNLVFGCKDPNRDRPLIY